MRGHQGKHQGQETEARGKEGVDRGLYCGFLGKDKAGLRKQLGTGQSE